MSTVALEGNLLHLRKRMADRQGGESSPPAAIIPLNRADSRFASLTQQQAQSLKLLTFGGSNFHTRDNVKLEARFIRDLQRSKDPDEKAGLAELLGQAHSINAVPALTKLLNPKEDIRVRMAAARALGTIGASTHEDGFTRTSLATELVRHYGHSKKTLMDELGQSGSSIAEKRELTRRQALRMGELNAILEAVGKLNVTGGNGFLKQEYAEIEKLANQKLRTAETLLRGIRQAEESLNKELEEVYGKPLRKVKEELMQGEYETLRAQQKFALPSGEEMTVMQAMAAIRKIHAENHVRQELLHNVVKGLGRNDAQDLNTFLRKGLASDNPQIKATTLQVLGKRGQLHYTSDIHPALSHSSPEVRDAAVNALFDSGEKLARQKLVELLNPGIYFQTMRLPLNQETLGQYTGFINTFAANGDKYVNTLQKVALKRDFDVQSRKMAALTLSLMTREPLDKQVSAEAVSKAAKTLEALSTQAEAQNREEQDGLAIYATRLWLGTKDPQAVSKAIKLVECKTRQLSAEDQEQLLIAIHQSLFESIQLGDHQERVSREALDVLKGQSNAIFSAEAIAKLEKELPDFKEELKQTIIDPDAAIVLHRKYLSEKADLSYVERVRGNLDEMRPILWEMLDHPASPTARMVAAGILGTLKDSNDSTIQRLIDKTRSPLKGIIDWDEDPAYRGDPSRYGATMRVRNMEALGRIGSEKGLGVMLDALEDPILKGYALKPLASIADAVNDTADEKTLERVRGELLEIMSNPDPARAARAQRIEAAGTLFRFNGGVDAVKNFIATTPNPNFKRHAMAGLVINDYALDPKHPDHDLVRPMLVPELGIEKFHKQGITGKGVDIAVVDGGYVDKSNTEAFQNRVRLPARAGSPEHYHPTMVASTAAGNGRITGVAPDSMIYSDKWPDLDGKDPMEGYKKMIAGKLRGENNIRVINNSWGLTNNAALIYKDIRDMLREYKKVVQMAEKAGIQIVFSAGNEGEGLGFPGVGTLSLFGLDIDKLTQEEKADLDYILGKVVLVGASNTQGLEDVKDHRLAEFSSVGDSLNRKLIPTVVAPGVDMMVYSWDNGASPKELVNGTSFSGPYVSGLIALMFQANPKLTPQDVRDILTKTAVKLPDLPDTAQGYGEVVPDAAIAAAKGAGKKAASA